MAGKSTSTRLEHTPKRNAEKYHKIDYDAAQIEALLVDLFIEAHARPPRRIVLDPGLRRGGLSIRPTCQMHGRQEGRFFDGYYDNYCYLPLYVFCGRPGGVQIAVRQHRRLCWCGGGDVPHHWPDPPSLAARADHAACRQHLCSGRAGALVRGEPGRLRVWFGSQFPVGGRTGRALSPRWRNNSPRPASRPECFARFAIAPWTAGAEGAGLSARLSTPRRCQPPICRHLAVTHPLCRALYEDLYCARGEAENRIGE